MTKRKKHAKSSPNRQGAATLRTRGSNAFHIGDYNQAIETWERVRAQSADMLPAAALAEAYFRRGQELLAAPQPNLELVLQDMQRAVELQPEDPCYAYHLGLVAQRCGRPDTAIINYEKVRRSSSNFARRAAYPLALALLQQGIDPATRPVWGDLTDSERAMLRNAGVFRRRPYILGADTPLLWQGLVALDGGEAEKARQLLQQTLQSPASPQEAQIAHYYLGVLAAQAEDWDTARKQWTTAYVQGYRSDYLSQNLGELYFRLAEQCLSEGDAESALAAVNESARHTPNDNRRDEMLAHIYQQLGYQAASAGQWEKAYHYWEAARNLDGGSFRLAYNLALAHEKAEDFIAAGEMWREALRRRPRKADHPDAITDEQVSLLWKRAAECYIKAGEYEEAINVYKQAVKWNPDSLETRMALVEGMINDGRFWAAENELQRILEKDKDYIPALLRMGEVVKESGTWWSARNAPNYWKRVLELDADNVEARQSLADYYLDQAENSLSWSNYNAAISNLNEALVYRPHDGYLLARLGGCYYQMGQLETAESYFEQALTHSAQDLRVYEQIIHMWLDEHEPERAWELMRQAEALVKNIPMAFYLAQGIYAMEVEEALGPPWLDRAVEVTPPEEEPLAKIGQLLVLSPFVEMAQHYLERALAAGQDIVRTYTSLAMLALRRGDSQTARRHVREAEKAARQSRDPDALHHVKITRDLLHVPPDLLNMMLRGLGPGLLRGDPSMLPFLDFADDDDYDDEEEFGDDDGFFNPFRY